MSIVTTMTMRMVMRTTSCLRARRLFPPAIGSMEGVAAQQQQDGGRGRGGGVRTADGGGSVGRRSVRNMRRLNISSSSKRFNGFGENAHPQQGPPPTHEGYQLSKLAPDRRWSRGDPSPYPGRPQQQPPPPLPPPPRPYAAPYQHHNNADGASPNDGTHGAMWAVARDAQQRLSARQPSDCGSQAAMLVDEVEEAQGGMMPPSRGSLHARPVMPAQRGRGGGGFYVPETQL